MTLSSVVRMVQEEQDEVVYITSVQWWLPSQETRQNRVDRPGTEGERLDVLEAWRGEVVPYMQGFATIKPSPEGRA
jgi:hypothetical protein